MLISMASNSLEPAGETLTLRIPTHQLGHRLFILHRLNDPVWFFINNGGELTSFQLVQICLAYSGQELTLVHGVCRWCHYNTNWVFLWDIFIMWPDDADGLERIGTGLLLSISGSFFSMLLLLWRDTVDYHCVLYTCFLSIYQLTGSWPVIVWTPYPVAP